MYDSKPYYYGTGRRKHSVARVRMYPGTGKITINGRDIDEYFGLETLKLIVRQPMEITNTLGRKALTRVRIYKGEQHNNQAQNPTAWTL